MRGNDTHQQMLFSSLPPEASMPRSSMPREKLLRSSLQQILHPIRNERMLAEQLHSNLPFRWFIVLSMDESIETILCIRSFTSEAGVKLPGHLAFNPLLLHRFCC